MIPLAGIFLCRVKFKINANDNNVNIAANDNNPFVADVAKAA